MTDEQTPAPEAGDEVVADEAVTYPKPGEDDEGQVETQPAEGEEKSDPEDEEKKSKSQERRERRKAEQDRLRTEAIEADRRAREAEDRLKRHQEAARNLPKPKQADFPDYEEYQAALSAYHSIVAQDRRELQTLEEAARAEAEQAQRVQQQQKSEAAQNWAAQREEAVQRYSDFDVTVSNPNLPISAPLAEMIQGSDVAADVAYHLGKNPDIARDLSGLDPVSMARAFGRLEAQVSAPKPKPVSTAPAPITPVRPKATPVKDPEKMSPSEYRAWRDSGGSF